MGFRLAQRANGVSQLHGDGQPRACSTGCGRPSTRPRCRSRSITNGVHAPTWVAREVFELAARAAASEPTCEDASAFWEAVDDDPRARDLWRLKRAAARAAGRRRAAPAARVLASSAGSRQAELGWIDDALDPDVLTIGFARRVPSYKRLTLMLRDPERLKALLLDPERPIQLVIAGKSHPADDGGKKLIQEIVQVRRRPRGPAPHRLPAQLRHRDGPAALPRLRRVAEQPAAPLRGLRHLGHEGRAQRRPEPVDPRRLVGRVVRRQQRLGDPVRRRRRRPRPPRRPRGRRRSTT